MAQAGRLAATAGHEFRQAAGPDEYWVCQVLARAPDGRVGRAMLRAVEQTGFIYYRDVPRRFRLAFEAALRGEGLDPTALLAGFSLEESRAKPWARIETGVNRDFLWRAHQAALGGEELDYCLGRGWRAGWCALCGACSTPDETRRIVSAAQEAGPPPEVLEQKRRALRAAEGPVNLLVEVGCAAAGLPRRFAGVALARALMLADEHLVPLYRGYADAFWATGDGPVHVTGADAISLLWLPTAREALSALAAEAAGRERVNVALGAWGRWIGLTPHGWRPAGLVIESPFPFDFGPYATRRGLKHRVLRVGDDAWRCEFAPAALRKRVVSGIAWSRSLDGGYRVEVALGEKFSALEFLEEAFRLPDRRHAARLRARSVGPAAGA
jgi:hypothetical protein